MRRVLTELDDRFPSLFEPSTVLPSQFFNGGRGRAGESGERRLLAAVLQQALADATGRFGRRRLREARRWMASTDRVWALSFLRICDELDLDASCIQRSLEPKRPRGFVPMPEMMVAADVELRRAVGV